MDEIYELSEQAPPTGTASPTPGVRRDEVCEAVAILAELRGIPGTTAYQILVSGAERIKLSVRETARLVVMSPTVADQVAIAG